MGAWWSGLLGVHNSDQIDNRQFRTNGQCSNLIKSKIIEDGGRDWYRQGEQAIRESTFICLYGVALGETDTHWWEIVTQWLCDNAEHILIIYWHYRYKMTETLDQDSGAKNDARQKFMRYVDGWFLRKRIADRALRRQIMKQICILPIRLKDITK